MVTQNLASHLAAQLDSAPTLYQQVALRISELIEHGTLRPGERVPSVRKYSTQQDVSIATVMQAYRLLESQGWIEARPQSGYYVKPKRWTPPPEPEISWPERRPTAVSVGGLVMKVIQAVREPELVGLGSACPSPQFMPTRQLNRIMASIGRRSPFTGNSYDVPPGVKALRVQIARRALEAGCTLAPDEIVTTCGTMEALNLCLRAVAKPGDTIAIESPAYFGFLQIIESLGMKACEIPTCPREGVCLDELAKSLDRCCIKACMFSTNFSNPLGSCMPDEKKQRLVELLADREIPLIEDDIYGDLAFAPTRPKTAKAFDKQGLVLLCSSFSKTLAPGYRVGWAAPGGFQEKVELLKFVNTGATATLPQMAIADFLANGGYNHHLRKIRRCYEHLVQQMSGAVTRHFPPGTKITRPSGGHVLWVELPPEINSLELLDRALASKISIAPGPIFSAKQRFQNFIRLNCANPWSDAIEGAIAKLGQIMMRMVK